MDSYKTVTRLVLTPRHLHAMGRPTGSPTNRHIALEFSRIVTRPTGNEDDLLARCGQCSLFSTLQEMFPCTIRDGTGGERDGLSESEFNKLLQVALIIPFMFLYHMKP